MIMEMENVKIFSFASFERITLAFSTKRNSKVYCIPLTGKMGRGRLTGLHSMGNFPHGACTYEYMLVEAIIIH